MIRRLLLSGALALSAPLNAQEATMVQPTDAQADRKLFALLLSPGAAWKPGRPFAEQGLRPHFDYWMALFRAGRIATAGPLGVDRGLVILLAPSLAEAQAIADADPAIVSGIFVGEVQPYAPPMISGAALEKERPATGAK